MLKICNTIQKQMKFVLLLMSITPGIIAHSTCSIKMCLRWTKSKDILKIICKVNDLHLPVSIHNNKGIEVALCSIPFPFPSCTKTYDHTTVKQNIRTNETEVTVKGQIDHRMSGNWSCRHGHGKHDSEEYIEVIIPPLKAQNQTEENDDFHCLKEISFYAVIGAFVAIVMLSIFWAICKCVNTRCRGQHASKLIQWTDDIDNCFQTKTCQTFSLTDKKLWLFVCLLLVMLIGGALFGYFEKELCTGSSVFIFFGWLSCVLCVVLFLREKVIGKVSTCNKQIEEEEPNEENQQLQITNNDD